MISNTLSLVERQVRSELQAYINDLGPCTRSERLREIAEFVTNQAAHIEALEKALRDVVDGWDALPSGNYSWKIIEAWLADSMKPAIDNARKALSASVLSGDGKDQDNAA